MAATRRALIEAARQAVPSAFSADVPAKPAEEPRVGLDTREKAQDALRQDRDHLLHQLQARTTDLAAANRHLRHSLAETRQAEHALTERMHFERLLVDVSATFVHLPAEAVEARITTALELITVFLGAERGTLFEFVDDQSGVRATHHWTAPGCPPAPRFVAADGYRWLIQRLLHGATVMVTHLADLPPEAGGERAAFLAAGVKSIVVIPLAVDGAVLGAVTFAALHAERVWPEGLVQRLQLVGDLFGTALARVRAEEAKVQHLRELALALRVRTLGELTASLAHELRQPLTAILSNAQAAQRFLSVARPDLDEVREVLAEIVADDQRANAVIQRLHALLKRGQLTRSRFQVNEVVQEVVALLRSDAVEKQIEVRLELATALPAVLGDRVQVQQVVLNLLLNGFDAVCQAAYGPRQLLVQTGRGAPDTIAVSVCDTGVGLDEEAMRHMLEPFFTTKPEGLGMGLAICRAIIADHGGRLWGAPNTDRGATFHVTLPGA